LAVMGERDVVVRHLIDIGDGVLEVHDAKGSPGAATVCCCHPVDDFSEGTARLLRELVGARVVCINPRGVGASSAGDAGSLDLMVRDIERVRLALGIRSWVFWGLSGGGWLGQLYARQYPAALNGLVLESICACFKARVADAACVMSPQNELWKERLNGYGLVAGSVAGEALEWRTCEGVGEVLVTANAALLVVPTGYPASPRMKSAQTTFLKFDSRDWLRELTVPTLTLGSEEDPVVPPSHVRTLHDGLARSELVIVPGAAHNPSLQGSSAALQALRAFVAAR